MSLRVALLLFVCFVCSCTASRATAAASCEQRCVNSGNCCTGNSSGCQHPSCQIGCVVGAGSVSVADCNATCVAAKGCSFTFRGQTFDMCGSCSARWIDPSTLLPAVVSAIPFWPPGYGYQGCGSCDTTQCQLGCMMAFDPSLAPLPPNPPPPPAAPLPPQPYPNAAPGFNISETLTDHAVLQQAPTAASIYGNTGAEDDSSVSVTVMVTPSSGAGSYTVPAIVQGGRWRALLHPQPQSALTFSITATCTGAGCNGVAPVILSDIAFGDVYYCAGQSNMWLQLRFTFAHNSSAAAIGTGTYDNIRLASGDSQSQGLAGGLPPVHPWRRVRAAAALSPDDVDSWHQFSAPCWHFAEALTDAHVAAGKEPPVLGLVATAIGGSTIEEWLDLPSQEACNYYQHNANGGELNHVLWDANIRSFLNMSIKGWLFYQGENNAGSLHGNYETHTGYACMMPKLIALWRAAWSATPGTTDPLAPFGICTLSSDDSEGSRDMASFRFAQSGTFGFAPNDAMPNTFIAHGYDLADPWVYCGDAPQTKQCAGCDTADADYDCLQRWYMGPSIHPRLKKPFGQRLAASFLNGVYGWGGPVTGPTIAGCSATATALVISFNVSLLAGAALAVHPFASPQQGALSVLVNSTDDAATGNWVALPYALLSPDALSVDLTLLAGATPQAVKYAWGATGGRPNDADVICCASGGAAEECVPGQCPVFVTTHTAPWGGLPANPFLAKIIGGKCECPTPQCDSATPRISLTAHAPALIMARACAFVLLALGVLADDSIVVTPNGPVQGLLFDTHRAFLGVPYGAPPVGALRWAPPQPHASWTSVINATMAAPGCPQVCVTDEPPHICPVTQSEDCLFLNVYTPRNLSSTPMPVIVFIHGGNFHDGAAGGRDLNGPLLYDGQEFVNTTGCVLVVIQYRLSALGFLYLGGASKKTSIEGNFGLQDQALALEWVQLNIAAFGGDPTHVVASGQSAGAMSLSLHLSRPQTAGLFTGVIQHSNPYAEPYRGPPEALAVAAAFTNFTGCPQPSLFSNDWSAAEACLRGLDTATILAASTASETDILTDLDALLQIVVAWGPTVRTPYLPLPPLEAFQAGNVVDVPIIVGTTANETVIFVYEALNFSMPLLLFEALIAIITDPEDLGPLNDLYPIPTPPPSDFRVFSSTLLTDGLFLCPTRNATEALHVAQPFRRSKSYHYRYSHLLSWGSTAWGANFTECDTAVCHGSDLPQWFLPRQAPTPAFGTYTPDEFALGHAWQQMWANFARTGDPNSGTPIPGVPTWPPYDAKTRMTLDFNTAGEGGITLVASVRDKWCAWWDANGYVVY